MNRSGTRNTRAHALLIVNKDNAHVLKRGGFCVSEIDETEIDSG